MKPLPTILITLLLAAGVVIFALVQKVEYRNERIQNLEWKVSVMDSLLRHNGIGRVYGRYVVVYE